MENETEGFRAGCYLRTELPRSAIQDPSFRRDYVHGLHLTRFGQQWIDFEEIISLERLSGRLPFEALMRGMRLASPELARTGRFSRTTTSRSLAEQTAYTLGYMIGIIQFHREEFSADQVPTDDASHFGLVETLKYEEFENRRLGLEELDEAIRRDNGGEMPEELLKLLKYRPPRQW